MSGRRSREHSRDGKESPGAWPIAPRIPDARARSLIEEDAAGIRHEGMVESATLRRVQVPGVAAHDLVIRGCEIASLGAAASNLDRLVLEDTRLDACDLVGAMLERSRWTRVALDGCRLSGTDLDQSVLHDVTFTDCQLEHLRLQDARLEQVSFVRCSVRGAFLMESTLRRVRMIDCDLRELDLRHARLDDVDLRQSRLDGIGLETGQFAGLTVTSEQALELAIRIGGLSVDDRVVLTGRS